MEKIKDAPLAGQKPAVERVEIKNVGEIFIRDVVRIAPFYLLASLRTQHPTGPVIS